jgi:hypothetical protein
VINRERKHWGSMMLGIRGTKSSLISISFIVLVSGSPTLDPYFF